jgi:AraC-like DNA-binding protein
MTRAIVTPLSGQVDFFGIRFRPGVVRSFAECDARDLRDEVIPLADAGIVLPLSDDQLFREACLLNRSRLVLPGITRRLGAGRTPDAVVHAAIETWKAAVKTEQPLPPVAAVARCAGVTERSLERRFAAWAGYTPAQFRRLIRFRSALTVSEGGSRPWVDTAVRCGYADQAHLSREFREFASTTAHDWANEQEPVGIVQDARIASV